MSKMNWVGSVLGLGLLLVGTQADACGCFAPPLPSPEAAEFAVNQQAEQIIFEVQEGTISAHVRIFYQGDPEEFAWLLPMPSVPELALSNGLLFGLIDEQTTPVTSNSIQDLCPQQKYICRAHPPCPDPNAVFDSPPSAAGATEGAPQFEGGDSAMNGADPSAPPPVVVLAQERIGAYDTITFAAEEADLAVDWLNDNGFIVNETMSPYMQPFLDAGMVFIASRLVPGADVDEIRPLQLTYEAEYPSIPLQLTAIAAEPHMMVTAFIYAGDEFDPAFLPLVDVPAEEVEFAAGRSNYPMLLSRVVDEAGGNAFAKEYVGQGPVFVDQTGCCSQGNDWCYAGGDGVCQCPEADFDAADCAAEEELVEAVSMARSLSEQYSVFTRLTTRVSPDEMTFNPEFRPAEDPIGAMRLRLVGTRYQFGSCGDRVIDQDALEQWTEVDPCASMYCDYGECVITNLGAGCACDEGFVARTFLDADGQTSLTCVPEVNTVDFAAGGIDVPDACDGASVSNGSCVDVGGFAAVACDDGLAAAMGPSIGGVATLPACAEIERSSGGPGARNFTRELQDLDVCAPPPPACPANGWLEEREVTIEGVDCGDGPDPSWFEVPPAPDCSEPSAEPDVDPQATPIPATGTSATPSTPVQTSQPRPGSEGSGDAGSDADDDNTDPASSDSAESDDAEPADGDDADNDGGVGASSGGSEKKKDDGCSISTVGSVHRGDVWLVLLGAALWMTRRRRRTEWG